MPLSPQNVQAPFGAEVIRVNPSSVRFNLERTMTKTIPVVPTIVGQPPDGYEIGKVLVNPSTVEIEGPESRVNALTSIATVAIRLDRKQTTHVEQTADLDVPDPADPPAASFSGQRPRGDPAEKVSTLGLIRNPAPLVS